MTNIQLADDQVLRKREIANCLECGDAELEMQRYCYYSDTRNIGDNSEDVFCHERQKETKR